MFLLSLSVCVLVPFSVNTKLKSICGIAILCEEAEWIEYCERTHCSQKLMEIKFHISFVQIRSNKYRTVWIWSCIFNFHVESPLFSSSIHVLLFYANNFLCIFLWTQQMNVESIFRKWFVNCIPKSNALMIFFSLFTFEIVTGALKLTFLMIGIVRSFFFRKSMRNFVVFGFELFKISTQISSNLPIGLRTLDVDDHTLSLLSIHCFGFCVVVVLFVTWFLHWTEMWIGCSCCALCKIFDCRQQVRWQTTLSTTVQMRLNVNRFRLNWMRDDS